MNADITQPPARRLRRRAHADAERAAEERYGYGYRVTRTRTHPDGVLVHLTCRDNTVTVWCPTKGA